MMQFESTHELNAFRILDCDSSVTSFKEQPCEIVYLQDETPRSHFPDILIEVEGRKEFWEVKPRSEAARAEVAERTTILAALASWGYGYKVALAEDLAAQPRLANAIRLLQFGRLRAVTAMEQESIRLAVEMSRSLTWSDACTGVHGPRGREILCRLALQGLLTLDLSSLWTDQTRFFRGKVAF